MTIMNLQKVSPRAPACWQVVRAPGVDSVPIGLARQQSLADELASQSSTPSLMVWRCQPALLVTRSETRLPHFDGATANMKAIGWPVLLRKSGGGACPVGAGTVQVSMIEAAFPAATMNAKYALLARLIQATLGSFHITALTGSVAGAFCPGSYDLAVQGKKIAGMSQHWFRNRRGIHCVVTATSINIEEPPDLLAGVVNRFYESAGSPLRCQPAALTNIRLCGGTVDLGSRNLAEAVMNELGSRADMLDAAVHQGI
jgi:octanoyl-[GcvH]:protein N-octanoyltransferase